MKSGHAQQPFSVEPALGKVGPEENLRWYDATLLQIEGRGWDETEESYDRLPSKAKGKVPNEVWEMSKDSSGLAVRFSADTSVIQVRWTLKKTALALPHMPATGVSGVDLYSRNEAGNWEFVNNGRPGGLSNQVAFRVRPGRELLLYFPLYNGVRSLEIGIPEQSRLLKSANYSGGRKEPLVFYGTSITQGACASRPGMAATALVGRSLNIPVINLGFSGSGKMEMEMAKLLAELEPSIYILDCLWNMTPDLVAERVMPFVRFLRIHRPNVPIVLVEDSHLWGISPTDKGKILREQFDLLEADGLRNLYFMSNQGMLGIDGEATVDRTHPNDVGFLRQAEVFAEFLAPLLKRTPSSQNE